MTDEFKKKQEAIETWLREIVQITKIHAKLANTDDFHVCGVHENVHLLSEELEMLAFYMGLTLTYDPNYYQDQKCGRIHTTYKGVEIFAIWDLSSEKEYSYIVTCGACGERIKKPDRFCPSCGEKLEL